MGMLGAMINKIGKPRKPPSAPEPPRQIEFRPDDNMVRRGENIVAALGLVNDRFNFAAQIAGYLSMYRDWDAKQFRCHKCGEQPK